MYVGIWCIVDHNRTSCAQVDEDELSWGRWRIGNSHLFFDYIYMYVYIYIYILCICYIYIIYVVLCIYNEEDHNQLKRVVLLNIDSRMKSFIWVNLIVSLWHSFNWHLTGGHSVYLIKVSIKELFFFFNFNFQKWFSKASPLV